MRVAVEKLSGVEDAAVSLNEGRLTARFTREHAITLSALRQIIRKQGFSPREATVTVYGQVERGEDGLALAVPGAPAYRLEATSQLRERLEGLVGRHAIVEGEVARDEDEVTPSRITVRAVSQVRLP